MQETYAHELEGQTVIISSASKDNRPVGFFLSVNLLNGEAIRNVSRVDFDPILPNEQVYATLTLLHPHKNNVTEEQVRVQVAEYSIPAIVREERLQ